MEISNIPINIIENKESKSEETKYDESKSEETKYDESKSEETKYDESKSEETKYDKASVPLNFKNTGSKKIINKQSIYMNNYKKSNLSNDINEFVWINMFSNDEILSDKIYNLVTNPYQKKINLINSILDSEISLPLKNYNDIILFFKWISPLNVEYSFGSFDWNFSNISYGNKKKILIQNSISKLDMDNNFYSNYINKIKKILSKSKIKYFYFEFKSKRFNKIKDIIWAFDKN